MASCDFSSCFWYWLHPEQRAIDAEQNAENLGALYSSYVVETGRQLEEATRSGRSALLDMRAAKEQKNDGLLLRARAQARSSAAKVKELRERSDKYARLAASCERAVFQLQEARCLCVCLCLCLCCSLPYTLYRQYKNTVSALSTMQNQYKSMRLDRLLQGAEDATSDVHEAQSNLADIGHVLGAPSAQEIANPRQSDAELDAELELLLGSFEEPRAAQPEPQALRVVTTGTRMTAASYTSALLTNA